MRVATPRPSLPGKVKYAISTTLFFGADVKAQVPTHMPSSSARYPIQGLVQPTLE